MGGFLNLVPDVLKKLAQGQNTSATSIKTAVATPSGVAANVVKTHGTFTSQFTDALTSYQTSRAATGQGVEGVATGLASTLIKALTAYIKTDQWGAGLLDGQLKT
jgi:Excreted virulence factor EspC, type VII ESX diderm